MDRPSPCRLQLSRDQETTVSLRRDVASPRRHRNWIVGSSTNAAAGSIEIGLFANVSPFPTTPAFTAYNTLGALLSTDGGTTWQGGAQSGYGYFFAGQVQVPESSSSLPLVGLSSALLGFLALRRRR